MTTANQERADELDFTLDELQEMYDYLDNLRVSGVTNMYGAGPYLREQFFDDIALDKKESHLVLAAWMKDFS